MEGSIMQKHRQRTLNGDNDDLLHRLRCDFQPELQTYLSGRIYSR